MKDYSDRVIVDQTASDTFQMFLQDFRCAFLDYPEAGKLPDDIADLFKVRLFNSEQTGKLHIIVNFSQDYE